MKTVVSVTPIAVERDSRTFKQAASLARLGYRSIVVEAEPSRSLSEAPPFELITVGERPDAPAAPAAQRGAPGAAPARAPSRLGRAAQPVVGIGSFLVRHASRCRAVAAAMPPADLYYLHSQVLFPAVWWRERRNRTPFVYDAHDLYWTLRQDGRELTAATRGIWAMLDAMERLAAARATECVTVGPGVARIAEERFKRPFTVVRNAHDSRLDDDGVADLRTRLGLRPEDFLVAVSGNYKRGLAVEPMLQALALLPDHVHMAFVGAGYEAFSAPRAHFVPPVAPTQIVPLVRTADVAAVPYFPSSTSVRHALPNGFFHALAAGLPILYPRDLVDLRELGEQHMLGWEIDPERPESIRDAVRAVLDAPDMLESARAHVRAARDELSWASEEQVLARLVRGVVGECDTRRR